MKEYSHIIWDFNGTLLDDVEAGIKSENALLSRRGMPLIESVEKYHSVFTFPIIDYYRRLGHDVDDGGYDILAEEWVAEYLVNSRESPLQEGARELLEYFRGLGCRQVILSATERGMLARQVEGLGIAGYFEELLGLDNIKAYSKLELAADWLERERPRRALLIGDTTHDCQAAAALKADCILAAIGHQSRETLLGCGVAVVDTLREIPALLEHS